MSTNQRIAAVLSIVLLPGVTLQAATIHVTTTVDAISSNGLCSVREALIAANTDAAVDSCESGAGTDTIALLGVTYAIGSTNWDVTSSVHIIGASMATTVIDASSGPSNPVFDFQSGTSSLQKMTIENPSEGGVKVASGVTLEMVDCAITGSDSIANGGAIYNSGNLTVRSSVLSGNHGLNGGAIYTSDTLVIEDSLIAHNDSENLGGGILLASGSLRTADSVLWDNWAGEAGETDKDGGGIHVLGGSAETTIERTAIIENVANGTGGGAYLQGAVSMVNVTVSGNRATEDAGGLYGWGITLDCRNCTVAFNEVGTASARAASPSVAAGGVVVGVGSATFGNSILAANENANCTVNAGIGFVSVGYNVDSGASCGFASAGDQGATDPLLGPLDDTGVHSIRGSSPAVDAGNPAGCTGDDDRSGATPEVPILVDQRGEPRPLDGDLDGTPRCDSGAYELDPIIFSDDFETGDTTRWSGTVGGS